ncbi:MAG TPA: hypothetical protein VLA62_04560, partial [Solirubrobacterales bacterium]|nr:hypothetical protein [Solirubrobacterales bacterium]
MRVGFDFVCALGVFIVFLAPVGFAILRLGGRKPELADLGMALALGYSVVPALLLAELHLGGAWLVLPVTVGAALWIGRDWKGVLTLRALASLVTVPLLAAAFALLANASDVEVSGAGLSFRRGWDVFDRTFYAAVTAAAHRAPPPGTENPLFGGISAPGSYFPAFLALFLARYAGVYLVPAVLIHVPALGLFLLALLTERLLVEVLGASRLARGVTLVLLLLGGDLSWLIQASNVTALERT